jgi:hypothetical protein
MPQFLILQKYVFLATPEANPLLFGCFKRELSFIVFATSKSNGA